MAALILPRSSAAGKKRSQMLRLICPEVQGKCFSKIVFYLEAYIARTTLTWASLTERRAVVVGGGGGT